MKRVLLVLTMLAAPLAAQEQNAGAPAKPAPVPLIQKVFILKYADLDSMRDLLSVFGAGSHTVADMHALAVSASPATMLAIEEAIGRLDVPSAAPKNLDLTIDLVVGTDAEHPVAEHPVFTSVPKDLDSVILQLKGAFPFKGYRLLDILTLRTRAGKRASTQSSGGDVDMNPGAAAVNSSFEVRSASVGADGTTAHLDGVRCDVIFGKQHLTLQTDLDIKEGQKVVVGRMGLTSQQALFVVLTVKVLQ